MIYNYFKIAFRNLVKHKFYAIINISGLAIGIASFILIWLYILDELSYDRYHKQAENIFRLVNVYDFEGVGENSASSPFPVAWTMKNEYPGLVKNVTRVFNRQAPTTLIQYNDKSFNERNFYFADSTFFQVFDFSFIYGDSATALDEINSVVITESTATRYFGDENPIGKTVRFEQVFDLKITGIISNVPHNSHFSFDMIASIASARKIYGGSLPRTWVWNPCWTYVVVEKENAKALEKQFPDFIQKYFYDAEKENVSLYLQPLVDIHLNSKLDYEIEPNGNETYLYILGSIAFFLLIIAIINYFNLATATSAGRSREVGIKKVFGVYRRQLIYQFLVESILLTFIALLFSLLLIELLLPLLNSFTGKEISLAILTAPVYFLGILSIALLTGFISGIYPAFYLSAFNPIQVIRNQMAGNAKRGLARKVLVIMQFTISIILIIITLNIFKQINYLKNADTGFNREDIVLLPINGTSIARNYESFKKELLQNSNIICLTTVDDIIGVAHNTHEFRPEGFPDNKWQFYPALVVDYDFLKTFQIKLLAGRDYQEEMKTDPTNGILINEEMVRHVGWKSNEEAIGKKFRSLQGDERVIGVISNFNATSLHEASGPFVINMKETPGTIYFFRKYVAVKINHSNREEAVAFIENKWNETEKGRTFEYSFLDQELTKLYQDEEVLGDLALILTVIIIFIAILGLFGLASFMTEQRTKEIGIRKVYGASGASLIWLLSLEFIKLVTIAILVAWPVSYYLLDEWLNYFAYHASIDWFGFIAGGLIAFVLAIFITASRAYITSSANPVDTLKYE